MVKGSHGRCGSFRAPRIDTYAILSEIVKGQYVLRECGSLLLAESAAEAKDLERAARALDGAGLDFTYHPHDPLGRGYHAAIEQAHDGAVQPYELTQAILQQSGAELIANNELYHIEQDTPDCVTVSTRQWIFKARYVLLCTNAYSPLIDPYFIGKVIPTRAQCIVTGTVR